LVVVGVGYVEPLRSKLLKNNPPPLNEFLAYTENENLNLDLSTYNGSPGEIRTLVKHILSILLPVKTCSNPGRSTTNFRLISAKKRGTPFLAEILSKSYLNVDRAGFEPAASASFGLACEGGVCTDDP